MTEFIPTDDHADKICSRRFRSLIRMKTFCARRHNYAGSKEAMIIEFQELEMLIIRKSYKTGHCSLPRFLCYTLRQVSDWETGGFLSNVHLDRKRHCLA